MGIIYIYSFRGIICIYNFMGIICNYSFKGIICIYSFRGIICIYSLRDIICVYSFRGIICIYSFRGIICIYSFRGIICIYSFSGSPYFLFNIFSFVVQWTIFITTFVITAKFVITSIRSAQKSADRVFFSLTVPCYSLGKHTFLIIFDNKNTKRMTHKKTFQKYAIFMLWTSPYQVSF